MLDGIVSRRHTNGTVIYLPVASTSALFLITYSFVEVSNYQKQSVSDAFQIVVLPPSPAPTIYQVARREFAGAKLLNFLQTNTLFVLFLPKKLNLKCLSN